MFRPLKESIEVRVLSRQVINEVARAVGAVGMSTVIDKKPDSNKSSKIVLARGGYIVDNQSPNARHAAQNRDKRYIGWDDKPGELIYPDAGFPEPAIYHPNLAVVRKTVIGNDARMGESPDMEDVRQSFCYLFDPDSHTRISVYQGDVQPQDDGLPEIYYTSTGWTINAWEASIALNTIRRFHYVRKQVIAKTKYKF